MKKIIVLIVGFISVLFVGSCAHQENRELTSAEAYDILYTNFFQESRDSFYVDSVDMPEDTSKNYVKRVHVLGCYGNVEYILDASYQYKVNKVTGTAKLNNSLINGYVGGYEDAYSISSSSDTFNVVNNKDFLQQLTSKEWMEELCCFLFGEEKVENIKKEYDNKFDFLSGEIKDGNTIINGEDYSFTFLNEDKKNCILTIDEEEYHFSFDSFAIFKLPDIFTKSIYNLIKK